MPQLNVWKRQDREMSCGKTTAVGLEKVAEAGMGQDVRTA